MSPAPAVSRYHQINRFYMSTDAPNLGDHDFPNPGYLLCPSDYMALTAVSYDEQIDDEYVADELNDIEKDDDVETEGIPLEPEVPTGMITDRLGRLHFKKVQAGPVNLVLRSCKFDHSSGMTHCNDLYPVLSQQVKDGKPIAFIKVDNGPDWNLHSFVNSLYLCRLWKYTNLDVLGIVSYAARFSAYNNIEHLWSPLSKRLCSVVLPSILHGDDREPYKISGLTKEEKELKEKLVCVRIIKMCKKIYSVFTIL